MKKDYTILIGGKAGQGSKVAGSILGKIFQKYGYKVYIYEDYQSLIMGGHNFSEIRISEKGFQSRKKGIDFLIALDKDTFELHNKDLKEDGILIFNDKDISAKNSIFIDTKEIILKEGGLPIMANIILIAALLKTLGIEWNFLEKIIKEEIKVKTELNIKLAKKGYDLSKNLLRLPKLKPNLNETLLTGNEATALGLKMAGLEFYFAYPMTPATSIMTYLANNEEKLKVKVIQPENEIAVINMALGTSFAGKKSAVGTSGGGFALMTEALSLAGQSETPIVIVESQRGGPSTGMPTYNLQGDLSFILNAGHGDFPKFIIAPFDAQQCLFYSALSLKLAWRYQTPVILLLDKDISENTFTINKKIFTDINKLTKKKFEILWKGNKGYKRYLITKSGISPLAFPGKKGIVVKSTSYEHDEYGITIDDEENVIKMQEKRYRKYQIMQKDVEKLPAVKTYGNLNSKVVLFSFGISTGVAEEIAQKKNLKLIQPIILEPFPKKQIEKEIRGAKKFFTIELNTSGQLAKLLSQNGINIDEKILKYTGRPFFVEEVEEKLNKII